MKTWRLTGLVASGLVASVLLASTARAQLPGAGPPAPVPPPLPGAAAPAAPAGPANLFSFLFPSPDQCAKFKECIHNSPLGDMLKSFAKPVAMGTGGLIGSRCGTPTADDLKKLAEEGKLDGAEGAAAAIKKSEAEAAARRAAVRYLGTVECNYWPEAKAALIASLRGDPNECVRFEAALALGRGCCCNKDTMEALRDSVNGKQTKFPPETSERVRAAAGEALARCAAIVVEIENGIKKEESKEGPVGQSPTAPSGYVRHGPPGQGILGLFTAAASVSNSSMPAGSMPAMTASSMPSRAATLSPVVQTGHEQESMAPSMAQPNMAPPTKAQSRRGVLQIFSAGYTNYKAQIVESSRPAPAPVTMVAPTLAIPTAPAAAPTRGWVVLEEEGATPAATPDIRK